MQQQRSQGSSPKHFSCRLFILAFSNAQYLHLKQHRPSWSNFVSRSGNGCVFLTRTSCVSWIASAFLKREKKDRWTNQRSRIRESLLAQSTGVRWQHRHKLIACPSSKYDGGTRFPLFAVTMEAFPKFRSTTDSFNHRPWQLISCMSQCLSQGRYIKNKMSSCGQ